MGKVERLMNGNGMIVGQPLRRWSRGLAAAMAAVLPLSLGGCPASAPTEPGPPIVTLETTLGNIEIETAPQFAPRSTENFVAYVTDGFYDGLIFHRVVPNFVIQAGGFEPGLELREPTRPPIYNESGNGLSNTKYTVGMARTDDPNSAASEFYINLNDNPALDASLFGPGYAVFGRVIAGYDVVDAIGAVETGEDEFTEVPVTDVVIIRATVRNGPEQLTPEWQAFLDDFGLRAYGVLRSMILTLIEGALLG
jgi:peptidyl-prolyl cis-trans isomerase B (cyclophilin B)